MVNMWSKYLESKSEDMWVAHPSRVAVLHYIRSIVINAEHRPIDSNAFLFPVPG